MKGLLPSAIPNPLLDFLKCGRHVKSTICDPENILKAENKNVLEGFINQVKNAEIGVLVIKLMDKRYNSGKDAEERSELFARQVHDDWGIGSKDQDNGILIFLSTDDRVVFISTGTGVSKELNVGNIDGIIGHMRPYLQRKDYATAIEHSVLEIKNVLGSRTYFDDNTLVVLFVFALFVFFGISAYKDHRKMKKLKKGRAVLSKMMAEVERDENGIVGYESQSCPICLEDFSEPCPEATTEAPNRPMTLQCKHIFCYSCLSDFFKTPGQKKCPICRSPIKTDQQNSNCTDSHQILSPQSRYPEYQYRLERMHVLYPEVVDYGLFRSASTSLNQASLQQFRQVMEERRIEVNRIISSSQAQQQAASIGNRGTRITGSSFGGGKSSGGRGGRF